jgi:hypothetical protein
VPLDQDPQETRLLLVSQTQRSRARRHGVRSDAQGAGSFSRSPCALSVSCARPSRRIAPAL